MGGPVVVSPQYNNPDHCPHTRYRPMRSTAFSPIT
jgi:hypothetical protein